MTARRLAMLSLWVTVAMVVPCTVLLVIGPDEVAPSDVFAGVAGFSFLLVSVIFTSVGALVAVRMPENRIGWLFCFFGVAIGAQLLAWQYADVGLNSASGRLPGDAWAAGFPGEFVSALFGLSLLLFPDGRLPSRRWWPVLAMLTAAMVALLAANILRPGPYEPPFSSASNPLGVAGLREEASTLDLVGWVLVVAGTALAAVAPVVRLRASQGPERQQLKVVLTGGAFAATAAAALMGTWFVWPEGGLQWRMALAGLSFAMLPAAAGVSILRYRLYDIDVVINRALVYGALTVTLAGAYVGTVLLLQLVLDGVTGDSSLAVAASTLAVAALFRPARSRIQGVVDRRFYRRKYNAEQTLEAFASRLRHEVALDAVSAELRRAASETMEPAHVSLWLRDPAVRR